MTKKVVTFWTKNRVTPSVTAPGDANLSEYDYTASHRVRMHVGSNKLLRQV